MRRDGLVIRTAGIIAVGDEVLMGEVVNTNGAYLASRLKTLGVSTVIQTIVGDSRSAILDALDHASQFCDLIVTIGGLGPTQDDVTVAVISEFVGRGLHQDPDVARDIEERHSRNPGWQNSVAKQAQIVEGAHVWHNAAGTAPGQMISWKHGYIVLLPGPPREFQALVESRLEPWLMGHTSTTLIRDTYTIFNMGESTVAHYLAPLLSGEHPKTGIYASPGRVDIRFEDHGRPGTSDTIANRRAAAWARGQLPVPMYRLHGTDRALYLVGILRERNLTVAAMESLTGGLLMDRLIAVPGASFCVAGGIVAYTDTIKERFGVSSETLRSFGAVSQETVEQMAVAVGLRMGADVGLATTGYAGPDGGDPSNPVGTYYVCLADRNGKTVAIRREVHSDRQGVRQAAVETALSLLWQYLNLPLELHHEN